MSSIVHFGKFYFPDLGGIESVTLSLAKGAAAAGHSVTVVCFTKMDAYSVDVLNGVRVIRVPIWRVFISQPLSWRYFLCCLRESRRADIVHLHAPNVIASLCGILVSKKNKLIVHWHSDIISKGLIGYFLGPLEFLMLKRASTVIATSNVYARASAPLRRFYSKIIIVPIGVQDPLKMADVQAGPFQIPDFLAATHGKKVILAIGRLVPYKGFNVLIDAAQHLSQDAVVFIVGTGPLKEALETKIAQAKLSDRVYLIGRQGDEELRALLKHSTLFCLPSISRSEAFGVVLIEAMAHGLPIVAADIPGSGVPWVNQDLYSGINVAVGDPIALANACNLILESSALRLRYSNGARERYLSNFTEEASVSLTLEIYHGLSKSTVGSDKHS